MLLKVMDDAAKRRIELVLPLLNERQRRLYLAAEVQSLGYGALKEVHELTGVALSTIILGQKELFTAGEFEGDCRIRKKGSGGSNKFSAEKCDILEAEIERVMETTFLDDRSGGGGGGALLSWTIMGLREIADLLCERGMVISYDMVGTLLVSMGYSLHHGLKMLHFGGPRPDRATQFKYVNQKCVEFLKDGQPVISIVSEEHELIDDFRHVMTQHGNVTSEQRKNCVFPVEQVANVASHGVFTVNGFLSFMNLGVLPGMVDFGVEGILRWWRVLGRHIYGNATKICVVSDGGGRGGVWYKLWKKQLQVLADVSGLEVHVLYLPPGTSRWHTVRHELFCFTKETGADGGSSVTMRVAIKILSTTDWKGTPEGCVVMDDCVFGLELTVTDEELGLLNLVEDEFYGHWNYVIRPK
jgi:transposase